MVQQLERESFELMEMYVINPFITSNAILYCSYTNSIIASVPHME